MKFLIFILVIGLIHGIHSDANTEKNLRKYLLDNYDIESRPRQNPKDAVNVTIRMHLKEFKLVQCSDI